MGKPYIFFLLHKAFAGEDEKGFTGGEEVEAEAEAHLSDS